MTALQKSKLCRERPDQIIAFKIHCCNVILRALDGQSVCNPPRQPVILIISTWTPHHPIMFVPPIASAGRFVQLSKRDGGRRVWRRRRGQPPRVAVHRHPAYTIVARAVCAYNLDVKYYVTVGIRADQFRISYRDLCSRHLLFFMPCNPRSKRIIVILHITLPQAASPAAP